jgi:hypothetical protein
LSKLALVSLCLLLSAVSFAGGSINPDLASLRNASLLLLRGRTTGDAVFTTAVVDNAVNMALSQVCTDFPALEKLDTLTTNTVAEGLTLPADFNHLGYVFRIVGDSVRIPLSLTDPMQLSKDQPDFESNLDKRNSTISVSSFYIWGNRLMLAPKPAQNGNKYLLQYYADDAQLVDSTDLARIGDKYLIKVVQYACVLLAQTARDYDAVKMFTVLYGFNIAAEAKK